MKKEQKNVMLKPVLSVTQIQKGPERGRWTLTVHGRDQTGNMSIVELRIFDTFNQARYVYSKLLLGAIKVDDVPEYEIPNSALQSWGDRGSRGFTG